jgi:hypothetical protein
LLLFLFVVAMIVVWWEMENVPFPPYDLLKHSHALLKHILVFHWKENLGLCTVQAPIQVLVYGCLEGLFETIYIVVTKLGICL